MVEMDAKLLDDCAGILVLVESWMYVSGRASLVVGVGRVGRVSGRASQVAGVGRLRSWYIIEVTVG